MFCSFKGKQTYRCIYCRQQYSTRNATKFRQHLVDRCESVPQEVRDELATECMESTRTWTQAKVPVWSHFELWEETGICFIHYTASELWLFWNIFKTCSFQANRCVGAPTVALHTPIETPLNVCFYVLCIYDYIHCIWITGRIHLMMKCDKIPVDLRFKLRKESNELYTSALAAKTQPKQKKVNTVICL
jgi:hypothetical protein